MGKAVSHLAVQVISYINGEKKPDFWHCKLVIYFLVPRQGKIRRWNDKISDWVWLADAGHAEVVDWLFEVSEINHLWKGMSFVYSVVSVASTQFLENCFLQCCFLSWILLFICTICAASIVFTAHNSPPHWHAWSSLPWLVFRWMSLCSGWKLTSSLQCCIIFQPDLNRSDKY